MNRPRFRDDRVDVLEILVNAGYTVVEKSATNARGCIDLR